MSQNKRTGKIKCVCVCVCSLATTHFIWTSGDNLTESALFFHNGILQAFAGFRGCFLLWAVSMHTRGIRVINLRWLFFFLCSSAWPQTVQSRMTSNFCFLFSSPHIHCVNSLAYTVLVCELRLCACGAKCSVNWNTFTDFLSILPVARRVLCYKLKKGRKKGILFFKPFSPLPSLCIYFKYLFILCPAVCNLRLASINDFGYWNGVTHLSLNLASFLALKQMSQWPCSPKMV